MSFVPTSKNESKSGKPKYTNLLGLVVRLLDAAGAQGGEHIVHTAPELRTVMDIDKISQLL